MIPLTFSWPKCHFSFTLKCKIFDIFETFSVCLIFERFSTDVSRKYSGDLCTEIPNTGNILTLFRFSNVHLNTVPLLVQIETNLNIGPLDHQTALGPFQTISIVDKSGIQGRYANILVWSSLFNLAGVFPSKNWSTFLSKNSASQPRSSLSRYYATQSAWFYSLCDLLAPHVFCLYHNVQ